MMMKCPIPARSVAHRLRAAREPATETAPIPHDVWFENCESGYDLWELSATTGNATRPFASLVQSKRSPARGGDRFNRRVDDGEDAGLEELTSEISWEKHGPRRK